MSQPVLVKAYGAFANMPPDLRGELTELCSQAIGPDLEEKPAHFSDGLLRVSFEGIWFPADEIRQLLEGRDGQGIEGKLDILDIENWRMTRLQYLQGGLNVSTVPLNNVLDYSGF